MAIASRPSRRSPPYGALNTARLRTDINDLIIQGQYARYQGSHNPPFSGAGSPMARRLNDGVQPNPRFEPNAIAMGSLHGNEFLQVQPLTLRKGPRGSLSFVEFDFKKEVIYIKATLDLRNEGSIPLALRPLDAELHFDDIAAQGITVDRKEGRTRSGLYKVTVTISTRRPPKFFVKFETAESVLSTRRPGGRDDNRARRRRATAMDFAISGTAERDAGPVPAIPEGPCAYPTFWNTWRWTFELNSVQCTQLLQCTRDFTALAEKEPNMDLLSRSMRTPKAVILGPKAFAEKYGTPDWARYNFHFSTRTLIEGLIAHGILKPGDVAELKLALDRYAVALHFKDRLLESFYNEDRIRNVTALVRGKSSWLRHIAPPVKDHLVLIRTVLVTPTRLVISPPQREPSNSVTRKYADRLDGLIRVQFADEEDKLFVLDGTREHDAARPDVGLMARVRRALQHGIVLGGRRFLPVASSSSQQKDHAIWYIDTKEIDGLALRQWMGQVHETIVAKHAARMGLPFSSTRGVNIHLVMGPEIPDIERNGYCFTDGVGLAGSEVMREAAKVLGATNGVNSTPSAIQFRLGGAKGVLVCFPDKVGKHEVRLRPSNTKFQSDLIDLNVVRLAKYQVAFLNRQFINIMCHNGVPVPLIIEIFTAAVNNIKGLKERVRNGKMTPDDKGLINMCTEHPLQALIKAGFNKDPLLLDIVEIVECRALQDLKWRARIKLPQGVFLIGVADETGLLKEGELFCQFQENDETRPTIVQSEVLICRAPALHPGDVRRAQAVDCPQLRHLKNVIVFNVKGKRDLPNMLGGGDLDGDDYTLIWDQRFVRTLQVQQPMDYTAPPPKRVPEVTQAHLNENFVNYILNDTLGQVDNWHLINCDLYDPFHPYCMELSQIHSTAVDFQKTGVPAQPSQRLKPKPCPDFMNTTGTKRDPYFSEKVLGQIFRIVQPDPHFRPCDIKSLNYPVDPRFNKFPKTESIIDSLKPVKAQFENALRYDMRRYRVFEPEIPSGIAIKNKRRRRARDQNLNEPLRDSFNAHVAMVRQAALDIISSITFTTRLQPLQVIARNAYALTYERQYVVEWEKQYNEGQWGGETYEPNSEESEEFIEIVKYRPMVCFAWCFWQELIQVVNLP